MDAAVGTEQPKETYWDRMKEYFHAHNKSGNERSAISLRPVGLLSPWIAQRGPNV